MSPDGSSVFVTGQSSGAGYNYATLAYDASTGAQLWVTRYAGSGSSEATDIGISPDGSTVVVTGSGYGSTSDDFVTFAYNASTGGKLWGKRFNGQDNSVDVPAALEVSASAVFVTGHTYQYSSDYDFMTIAYALA